MKDDLQNYFDKLDAWCDGGDEGSRPIDMLGERGIAMPESANLADGPLHEALWRVINGLADIGFFIEDTDHLSDRQLYEHLEEALREPTLLMPENLAFACHHSPIGGCSEEDLVIYTTYYADEETRERWQNDFPDEKLPEPKPLPYDRDRLLPKAEVRQFSSLEPDA